ncbi:MAG: transcriptional regulator CtsR [Bacillota bacterium]|nr:MAG: transcriptional regulator CtsR [Bacillota bacterium]MBS3949590.1 CtsR family transcriptional regulator [Peptococcaceae bacterium]
MPNITDTIEEFLLKLLADSVSGAIEIQRGDIADMFSCAPSQINYVLQTRFVPERGFLVESRRGGGGYIRVTRLNTVPADTWQRALKYCSGGLSQETAAHIVESLYRAKLVSLRETKLMLSVVDRKVLRLDLPWRDELRAHLMRAMLGIMMITKEEE